MLAFPIAPDELYQCNDFDGGTGSDAENDLRPIRVKDASKIELAPDLVSHAGQPLIVSPR